MLCCTIVSFKLLLMINKMEGEESGIREPNPELIQDYNISLTAYSAWSYYSEGIRIKNKPVFTFITSFLHTTSPFSSTHTRTVDRFVRSLAILGLGRAVGTDSFSFFYVPSAQNGTCVHCFRELDSMVDFITTSNILDKFPSFLRACPPLPRCSVRSTCSCHWIKWSGSVFYSRVYERY